MAEHSTIPLVSSGPCSHFFSCMQPSGWLVVLAGWHPRSQVANEGHCSTEARVPGSTALIAGICQQLHKVEEVDLSNLQSVDHGLHGTWNCSPLIETTQFTVELTKTFCLWGSNTFSIFQQSLSGSIERVCLRSDYDEVPWYQLRAFSVSFLILWLISRWARERQKPYFCWNWF